MSKLLPILKHPVDHALRYVAKRQGLKQRLRPLAVRVPFLYRWVVERRTRQIRADFLKAWSTRGRDPATRQTVSGCHLSAMPVKTVDEVLQAIRSELEQPQGSSHAN